jgi:histidine triad (HIT) family protein
VRGEIPSHTIYETDDFLAFLDINPSSPGHAQVIPKKHYRWVWDVPNAGDYFEAAKIVALAERRVWKTDWVLSKIVGDEIEHAHIWVYPHRDVAGDPSNFVENARLLRAALEEIKMGK